jgi:hypothetical protein
MFGTQMCTYTPCTDNKLKWFRDFQQVKWGLTGCDMLLAFCERGLLVATYFAFRGVGRSWSWILSS